MRTFLPRCCPADVANTLRLRVDLKREDRVEAAALDELELLVPNMVCDGCAEKISTVLNAMSGVREVKSKVSQKHVYVRYEPARVRKQDLKNAVVRAGLATVEE